jgi:hypothetical protein
MLDLEARFTIIPDGFARSSAPPQPAQDVVEETTRAACPRRRWRCSGVRSASRAWIH